MLGRVKDDVKQQRKAKLFVKRGIYRGLNCFVFGESSLVSSSSIVCQAVQLSCGFTDARAPPATLASWSPARGKVRVSEKTHKHSDDHLATALLPINSPEAFSEGTATANKSSLNLML